MGSLLVTAPEHSFGVCPKSIQLFGNNVVTVEGWLGWCEFGNILVGRRAEFLDRTRGRNASAPRNVGQRVQAEKFLWHKTRVVPREPSCRGVKLVELCGEKVILLLQE